MDSRQRNHDLIRTLIHKITIAFQEITLEISQRGLCGALGVVSSEIAAVQNTAINLPFNLRRRGVEARFIIGGKEQPPSKVDTTLVEAITQAHQWMERLTLSQDAKIAGLAREADIDDGEISRVLPLAFLAPDIVDAILKGRQPLELTARHLKRFKPLPLLWEDQRRVLGFD